MSYTGIKAGVINRLKTIPGYTAEGKVLEYHPRAMSAPFIYVTLEGFTDRGGRGQVTATRWRLRCRAVFLWQNNPKAELELDEIAEAMPLAVEGDLTLGGAVTSGAASVAEARGSWISVSGIEYRVYDVFVEVLDKAPFAGA